MENKGQVTVGITTYNHAKYIEKCVHSVLQQNYPFIEIIICDDSSTDNTQDILLKLKDNYPEKIKLLLKNENKGVTDTINTILDNICPESLYFCAIGGDDRMYKDKIATQVNYLSSNDSCCMCYHDLDVVDLDSSKHLSVHYARGSTTFDNDHGNYLDAIEHGCFFHCVSIMFKLKYLNDLRYDCRIPLASDWLFFTQLLASSGRTANHIPEILGIYGRTSSSITNKRPQKMSLELDLLNSCNILLIRFPNLQKLILNRFSSIILGLRLKDLGNYIQHVRLSFSIRMSIKCLIILTIYYLSFTKIKK